MIMDYGILKKISIALKRAVLIALFFTYPLISLAQEKKIMPVSGYFFLDQGTKDLQDDLFINPGSFSITTGEREWKKIDGTKNLSCESCHGSIQNSMNAVATLYPTFNSEEDAIFNLEKKINVMRTDYMGAEALSYESEELLGLTTAISYQSRGLAMNVNTTNLSKKWYDRGNFLYNERRGQLDMACSGCHENLVGEKLRGDVISQGQINAFPIFRIIWQAVGSRHRMFEWCNTAIRAEPYSLGSDEYLALEYYLALRGAGLEIESPGVRK
jgi:L-cysteine S-thiosulfotransferase